MKYKVTQSARCVYTYQMEIEAESPEEAIDKFSDYDTHPEAKHNEDGSVVYITGINDEDRSIRAVPVDNEGYPTL